MAQLPILVRNLKARELQYILSVHSAGSIRKSAWENNISQPALSKIIHDIEGELGVRLFERAGNRTVATVYGEIFIAEATRILASIGLIQTKIQRLQARSRHFYRIGGVPNPALRLIPSAFLRARERYPDLNVELVEGFSEQLVEDLGQRKYDFVIARAMHFEAMPSVKSTLLYPETGMIVAHCDHPLAGRRAVGDAELTAFRWILPPTGPTLAAIEQSFLNAGLSIPVPFFVNYGVSIVTDLLLRTPALTVMSKGVASPLIRSGELAEIDVGIDITLPSYAVYSLHRRDPDPVMDGLEDALVAVAREIG